MKLFRDIIIMHDSVQPRILESLLELIRQERCGANIEKGLLRSIIRMYSDLDVGSLFLNIPPLCVTLPQLIAILFSTSYIIRILRHLLFVKVKFSITKRVKH